MSESQMDEMCSEYLFFLSGHFYASLSHSCKCFHTLLPVPQRPCDLLALNPTLLPHISNTQLK